MSNIVAYTAPAGVSLVDIRSDATRYPRIKSLNGQSAIARLQQVVAMAYIYTGRPAEDSKIEMVATALYGELLEDKRGLGTGNITIEEIAHAVKGAILSATGDVYINIAFLYRAVCDYAENEGHEAQQAAYQRVVAQRRARLDASPVGAMLSAFAGETIKNTTLKPFKK